LLGDMCFCRMNMNPVCGFEVVPEWQSEWRQFVAARDRGYAAGVKEAKRQQLLLERSSRDGNDALEELFEAVADAFADLMNEGHPFAFKYCPTPGCSADKGTGNSCGIAHAVMERMGFPGIGLDHVSIFSHFFLFMAVSDTCVLQQHGRLFKSWLSVHRELHNVAESKFGRSQFKQLALQQLPAMHTRLFMKRVHQRHNPQGYALLMRKLASLSGGGITLNSAHLPGHLLLKEAMHTGDEIAEMQLRSIILRTKIPEDADIMPVVDVSASMHGIPKDAATFLGIIVALAQRSEDAAYRRMFLTFDTCPQL
jgi:hypothetical protein